MADDLFDTIFDMFLGWFGPAPARINPPVRTSSMTIHLDDVKELNRLVQTPIGKTTVPYNPPSFTVEQLLKIMPRARPSKVTELLPHLNAAIDQFAILSPKRMAAFIAQVAHETDQFLYTEEVWGPTQAQKEYEPPSHLATMLGNCVPGDGIRYKGRGAFQCTGRTNYRRYGHELGIDLENHPELAGEPANTFRIAGVYWNDHRLSQLADAGDFREITRRINGGYNGEASREAFWKTAKEVLGVA